MFSLIIAIVSIALVVAVTAIGGFYGGSAMSEAKAQADATRLKTEEQQILGAVDLFNADKGRYPADLQELQTAGYLTSIPSGWVAQWRPSRGLELIAAAYAQGVAGGWTTPTSGQPVYTTPATVAQEVCGKYNLASRGDDGILTQAFSALKAQCYGFEGAYQITIYRSGAGVSLSGALGGVVHEGGLPSADGGPAWWAVQPTGDIKAVLDPAKVPFAQLALLPTTGESFGDLQVGQVKTSAARTVINKGNIPAQALAITASGGFGITDSTCGSSLAAGASCAYAITFAPQEARGYSGAVTVTSSNGGSGTVSVSGTGAAPLIAEFNPASGAQLYSSSSWYMGNIESDSPAVLTVRNSGSSTLTAFPSTNNDSWATIHHNCGNGVAPGQSCVIEVYTPYIASESYETVNETTTLTVTTNGGSVVYPVYHSYIGSW